MNRQVEQVTSKLRRSRRTKYMYSWILGAIRERGQGATRKQAEKVWDFSIREILRPGGGQTLAN